MGSVLLVHSFVKGFNSFLIQTRLPSHALHAAAKSVYDESFITSLCVNLSLQAATEECLRKHRVPENVLFALDSGGLEKRFDIPFYDAVTLSDWSVLRRKQEDEADRARHNLEDRAEWVRRKDEDRAEWVRRKQEDEADRARHNLEDRAEWFRRHMEDNKEWFSRHMEDRKEWFSRHMEEKE